MHLSARFLEVSDQVVSLGFLLQTSEDHLGARDVLLGVLQVLEQGILVPGDTLADVGSRVREARSLTSLAAEQTVEVRTLLVSSTSLDGVALSTLGLEDLSTLSDVSHF